MTVWAATQNVHGLRAISRWSSACTPDVVHVLFRRGSGCYGLNGVDAVSFDAALLSQAVGKPVRVQLTRKDEMAWENYGTPFVIDQRVGLDRNGTIVAWDYESWTATRGGRIGDGNPGNIVTGVLTGFQPPAFAPRAATPATAAVQRFEPRAGVRHRLRRRPVQRQRDRRQRAGDREAVGIAILHRSAARAEPAPEHLRARIVHGRDRRSRQGRSGCIPAASLARPAAHRRRQRGGDERHVGSLDHRRGRNAVGPESSVAAASRAWQWKRGSHTNGWIAMVATSTSIRTAARWP